jgi:pimeloyl-ACP methyl ester carboxylesterase
MDRRRLWTLVRRVWITLGLSATAIFAIWSLIAYRASADARAAARSDAEVTVERDGGIWHFRARGGPAEAPVALVFFPGALVDPVAYAPLVRAAAARGFASYIIELPRRGAFGGATSPELGARLQTVLQRTSTPKRWVVAGHSRGAVIASTVASAPPAGFAGLVLIGTSHPRDVDLSALTVPVTKVVGTRDGLASKPEVDANKRLLPASTRWVWIDGGNHSQFGWYGFQPGDRRATISALDQRTAMIQAVLDILTAVRDDNN